MGLGMLNCREVTGRASELLDGELPLPMRVQMRLHLLMCRFCREYMRQMSLVIRALRRLPTGDDPSEALQRELLHAFQAERP